MESRREAWVDRVAGWRRSGRTAKEYASSIGVNAGSLSHWAWRLGHEQRQEQARRSRSRRAVAATGLIEVIGQQRGGEDGFELRLAGGQRVHIPSGFDAAALKRLVAVLEGGR